MIKTQNVSLLEPRHVEHHYICKLDLLTCSPFFLLLKIQGLACDRHRNMAGLNWLHGSDLSVSEIFYVLYPPANIITVPFISILETKSLSANQNSTFPTHWLLKGGCWPINILLSMGTSDNIYSETCLNRTNLNPR
jgi:hypothetical protein